ncbi:MAG: hypothetical protein WAN97_05445 [Candidatus Acidiferrales bacterium]
MKMIRGRFRAVVLMGAAASLLAIPAAVKAQNQNSNDNAQQNDDQWSNGNPAPDDNLWPYEKLQRPPVLAVVGDVACQPGEEPSGG